MEKILLELKLEIIRMLKENPNKDWVSAKLNFIFPPYINKCYTGTQEFLGKLHSKVDLILFLDSLASKKLFNFIVKFNQENHYNEIVFQTNRDDYENATISVSFNQEVEDNFLSNLPKSKRGKTIPWWKNPEETKGLE